MVKPLVKICPCMARAKAFLTMDCLQNARLQQVNFSRAIGNKDRDESAYLHARKKMMTLPTLILFDVALLSGSSGDTHA